MQGIQDVWGPDGLYVYENGIPVGLCHRICVPSSPVDEEIAAMLELSSRIGFQLLKVPKIIFDGIFVEDCLDLIPDASSSESRVRVVLGHNVTWLQGVLGVPAVTLVLDALSQLPHDAGFLLYLPDPQILIVTGKTPVGVLRSARYLASEGFGEGLAPGTSIVIPPHDETPFLNADKYTSPACSHDPVTSKRKEMESVAGVEAHSLHDLVHSTGLFQKGSELLPEFVARFIVKGNQGIHHAMVSICTRLCLEAGAVVYPVTWVVQDCESYGNRTSLFFYIHPDNPAATVSVDEGTVERSVQLRFSCPTPQTMNDLVSGILDSWFEPIQPATSVNWRSKIAALKSKHPDIFQRAMFDFELTNRDFFRSIASARVPEQKISLVKDSFRNRGVPVEKLPTAPLWQMDWHDSGELSDLEKVLVRLVSSCQSDTGTNLHGPLRAEVFSTVSDESFRTWALYVTRRLEELELPPVQLIYRNAHKSGLHWFLDTVLPELRRSVSLHTVRIEARRFPEDNLYLDLPQRFLQELFPADAILSRELGLPLNHIELLLHDDPKGPMFRVKAYDNEGTEQHVWSWEGLVHSTPYCHQYPEQGLICTPLAGVRIFQDGNLVSIAEESVLTNAERFWRWYQSVVEELPRTLSEVRTEPRFFRLDCHVSIDAEERKLNIYEEVISLPEALHEDIYFYTLHVLSLFGREVDDAAWQSPGAVIPRVHIHHGAPEASVQVFGMESAEFVRLVFQDGSEQEFALKNYAMHNFTSLAAKEVILGEDGGLKVRVGGVKSQALSDQCERWLNDGLVVIGEPEKEFVKDLALDVLQNSDVAAWLQERRSALPGVFSKIDLSFLGEPIYLVELAQVDPDSRWSRNKQTLYKPTLFINARHHANEVSSTNAALRLVEQLAENPRILEHLNLVLLPLQNTDGANLHKELMEEHPTWKHHSARFNACGFEFSRDYFNDHSGFGESRTYQSVWEYWHPDIVLDDHGIPSHEWIQPFSGYNSPPTFPVSYWIPHAQLYTIWNVLEGANAAWLESSEDLVARVNQSIAANNVIEKLNAEFLQRFIRWGHNFAPQKFPVEVSDGVMSYRWKIKPDLNSSGYLARFSEWVTADLITEVNDETVHGDALFHCVLAHLAVHEGILNFMSTVASDVSLSCTQYTNGTVKVCLSRQRPLRVRR